MMLTRFMSSILALGFFVLFQPAQRMLKTRLAQHLSLYSQQST